MATKLIGCILLLATVAGTLAGPISWEESSSTCALECPDSTKFAYVPDKTYEYQYESDIQTNIPDTTEQQSSLHMRATIQIEVISACEMNLKLTDVSLQDSKPDQYESRQHVEGAWEFKKALQEKAMRFAFIDGRIDYVCPANEEPTWVVNIKRGVLSGFQNTQISLDAATKRKEVDISGECPVEYSIMSSSWGVTKVKKVKDLLGCTERHGHDSAFRGTPYQIDSSIQSLPLMKSSYECDQEIGKNGLLIESKCKELHVFRPFSENEGGAQTVVNYTITYTKEAVVTLSGIDRISKRSSLLFDHTLTTEETDTKLQDAQQTLRQLCQNSREDIRPQVPELFAKLVRTMRMIDDRALMSLFNNAVSMCDKAEKYFRDAVPNLGTPSSLLLIRNLIERGRVTDTEASIWLTHLAFIPQPSTAMLAAIKPLLTSSGEILRKTALAISSMVHNYCRLDKECHTVSEVTDIIKVFENNLEYNCKTNGDSTRHTTVIMSLKALGNTGNAGNAIATLARCAQNAAESNEIRIAAINAFRRMPCSADRTQLLSLFSNAEVDSELRINAYLMLMHCPNQDLVNRVKEVLESEEINQVGSFVWTHLTNIMESSDPNKRSVQQMLEGIDLKAFDLDMRKFSRNLEWSLFSDMLNTGARVDSNVIFSSKSFVPRSGMVNLTIDLFGYSVNMLEAGARVEGMDNALEEFFNKMTEDKTRAPRALQQLDRKYKPTTHDAAKASYYLKIFGNEIRYDDFHNMNLEMLAGNVNYLDWLIKLSQEQQVDVTKSFMFLDSSLTIPTAVGMPLKLSVDGTATVNIQMNGKMDVRRMLPSPSTIDINGSIKPSAAVQINSEMSVDAFVARTGLKMVSTMHTSTVTQGKISLLEGRVFHFDLEMPRDKIEVFSSESKFYVLHRAQELPQTMIEQGRTVNKECYDLSRSLGVEFCGEMSIPTMQMDGIARFPFTGPASTSLYINKKDTFTKYHIEGSYTMDKSSPETEFKVNINTPGSRVDREIDVLFNLNTAQKTVNLNAKTPWKKATMRGEMTNTAEMKRVSAMVLMDDRDEYKFISQIAINKKKLGTQYSPLVALEMPGQPKRELSGVMFYRDNKKCDVDLMVTNVFSSPVSCKGTILKVSTSKRLKYDTSIDIVSDTFKGKFDGFVDNMGDSISSRIVVAYKYKNSKQTRIVFSNKIRNKGTNTLTSFSLDSALTTSMWPRYNGDISVDYTHGRNTFRADIDAGFDDRRRIKISKSATYNSNRREINLTGQAKLKVPFKNMDYEMNVNHNHKSDAVLTKANLKYGSKLAEFMFDAKKESTSPLKTSLLTSLSYPGRVMNLSHVAEEKRPGEYHSDLTVFVDKYTKGSINGIYKLRDQRHEVTATVMLPEMRPIEFEGHLKAVLVDAQGHAKLSYAGKKYYVTGKSSMTGQLDRRFDMLMDAAFGCPYADMAYSGKIGREGAVFNTEGAFQWDAAKHPEKKVTSAVSVTIMPTSPKANIRIEWYPNRFVEIEGEGNYETEGWYRTANDIQGQIKFTSTLPRFEHIMASFKHDYSHDKIDTTAAVSWSPRQKINTVFEFSKNTWYQMDSSLTVGTPFPGWRSLKAGAMYKVLPNKFDHTSLVQWERNKVQFDVHGTANLRSHQLEGEAFVTSTLPGYESMKVSGKHDDDGHMYNSNMDVSWGRGRQASATFTMEHISSASTINNNAEVVILTQVPGYRKNKLFWSHQSDTGSISTRLGTDSDNRQSTIAIDGNLDTSPKKTAFNANFMLNMHDLPQLRDIRAKIAHLHTRKGISSSALAQWAPNQVIEYQHEVAIIGAKKVEIAAKLTSPFKHASSITLESLTNFQDKITTQNEFKWNPNQKINVDGTLRLDGIAMDGQIRVTTPFRGFERTVLNAKNIAKEGGLWASHAGLDIANRHYEIDTVLGIYQIKKLSVDTTKMPAYGFMFDVEYEGHPLDFTTKAAIGIPDIIASPIIVELRHTSPNLKNIKSQLDIRTPWAKAEHIKATVGHRQQGKYGFITDASYEFPGYKASASNVFNANGWTDFNTKTTAQYQNKKFELITKLQSEPTIEGRIIYTSPYADPIEVVVKHEGQPTEFKSEIEISYRGYKQIVSDVDFMYRPKQLKASARYTSPYAERIVVSVNHNGGLTNFNNDAAVDVGDKRAAVSTNFNLNGNNLKTGFNLELPLKDVRNINAEYTHEGDLNNFNCLYTQSVNGQTITGKWQFSNAKTIKGSAELTTPYRAVRTLKAEFEHKGKKWNSFENSGSAQWNNKQYSASSELRWYGIVLRALANLKIPREEYVLKIKHKGTLKEFTNSAVVDLSSGNKYTGSSKFKMTGNKIEGEFEVATPHQDFDRMSGDFSHSGTLDNFETSAHINTPIRGYERFGGELTYNGRPERFSTTAKIETPFRKLPSLTTSVQHRGNLRNFDTTAKAEFNGKSVSGNVNYKYEGRTIEGSAKVLTNYRGYENFEGSFSHVGNSRSFKTNAEVKTPYAGHDMYSAKLEHTRNSMQNFKTNGEITTPYSHYERMAFNVNHNGDLSGMTTDANVETSLPGYEKFGFNINHNGDPRNVRSTVQMTSAVKGYERFAVEVNHKGHAERFESSAKIDTPWKSMSASVRHAGNLNNFNTEANIALPIDGYTNWGVAVNHNGDLNEFTSGLVIRTPLRKLPKLTISVEHRGDMLNYDRRVVIEYNGKQIEFDNSMTYDNTYADNSYSATYSLKTPYSLLNSVSLTAEHRRQSDVKTGKLIVSHNDEQYVDLDYSYTTNANKKIRVTFTHPHTFEFLMNVEGTNGQDFKADASFSVERQINFAIEMKLQNQVIGEDINRHLVLKMNLPHRVVGIDTKYEKTTDGNVIHTAEIQWDRDENSKLAYEVEMSSSTYRRKTYDGRLKFSSMLLNLLGTVNLVDVPGRQTTADVKLNINESIRIKYLLNKAGMEITETYTLSHPSLSRDAIVKTVTNIQDKMIEGEIEIQFERESINFKGKIADMSSGYNMKYVATSELTYPTIRLEAKFEGDIYNDRNACGGRMEFNYLTARKGMKEMSLATSYDKNSRIANLEMINPLTTVKITGSETYHDYSNSIHRYSVQAEKDGVVVKSDFGVDLSGRSVDAKFYTPANNMVHVYARYMRPALELKAYRVNNGNEIQDLLLNLNMDSDNLITGQAYVRPQIWSDLKACVNRIDVPQRIESVVEPVKQAIMEEYRFKKAGLRRAMQGSSAATDGIKQDVMEIYNGMYRAANRAYEANEFYMKDVGTAVAKSYADTARKMVVMQRKIARVMSPYIRTMGQWRVHLDNYAEIMKRSARNHYEQMSATTRQMIQRSNELKEKYLPQVKQAISNAREYYNKAKQMVMDAYRKVVEHPTVQQMVQQLQDMQPSDMFGPLRKLKYRADAKMEQMRNKYSTFFDALDDFWNNIARRQEIRDIAAMLEAGVEKANSFWQKYEVEKTIKAWLKNLSKGSWRSMKTSAINNVKDYFQIDRTRFTTYDPRKGNFEFEMYVPHDLKDLHKLPKIDFQYYIKRAQQVVDDLTPDEDWSVWDTIYKYKPSLNVRDWVPPFTAHATIAGNQHFVTFDKSFYEFAGECSYLLARDFINGRFGVVVNYQNQYGHITKKSLSIYSGESKVDILPDGRVVFNRDSAELPLELDGTMIVRDGGKILIDNDRSGVHIDCDLAHDRCTVAVSGWYYGKTAGLMGTYDNEPITDLTRSDNSRADNIEDMAESWIVGPRCRSTNFANTAYVSPDSEKYSLCASQFEDVTSPFRPCFKQVDPKPFMTMCLNQKAMERDEDLCDVASYYINECKLAKVNIRLPRMCVSCSLPADTGYFYEAENVTLTDEEVPRIADVVFVVQQGSCNRAVVDKLADIVDDLDKTFHSKDIRDVRYGVVGFGGVASLREAHSHTMGGQLMGDGEAVVAAVQSLSYTGESGGDVMSAVRAAAMYAFRTGASKSIVLLPCEACREAATRYTELQRLLIERDVRLHMLMQHVFKLRNTKSNKPKSGFMFGIDKDGLFIDKHVTDNELVGDAELKNQVTKPKDLCAALAEVTDGSVFSASQMLSQSSLVQKKFIDVMVRLWVKKAEPSSCQMCDCVTDNVGNGMAVCHHCVMNPIYNIIPRFNDEDYDYADSAESSEELPTGYDIDVEVPKKASKKYGRNRNKAGARRSRKD